MQPTGTVLVVDDRDSNRLLMKDMLETGGHHVLVAEDGPEAIALATRHRPDVVLLDLKMPGMDGFEVCAKLQAMAETAMIPIIFVTANYMEEADLVHGLELGAHDYLLKPITRSVLLARVGVMVRMRRSEERIRQLSMIDEFTGLFSKNYVLRRLEEEMKRAERHHTPLSVAMLDLDDFKQYNDHFGHQFGDEVLRLVSKTFQANVRQYDSLGRYGGDEFLLVQPETDEREAAAMVSRLQEKTRDGRFLGEGRELEVTFSAGLCSWDHRASLDELIRSADCALYAAKRAGKSQTVRYSELAEPALPPAVAH